MIRMGRSAIALLLFLGATAPAFAQWGQRGGRDPWWPKPPDGRDLTEHDKQERLEFLAKMLTRSSNLPEPGAEMQFLSARATELLDRAKQVRVNNFQFDSLTGAVINLLWAGDRIMLARKSSQVDEGDKRDAALYLQRCYFRVQQAEYFAGLSSEKESARFVTQIRSLYQQARSAYDAGQYDRAHLLGDASTMMVTALENIAYASLRIPDPPVIK